MSRWKPSVPSGNSSTECIGSQLGLQLCVYNTLRQQTWLQLLVCRDERPDVGVVHLQRGSTCRRSFMRSPSTVRKRCQRPPAWPRPRKTSAVPQPDASASCTLNTDGPLETPADSPASDVADLSTNQSADTRLRERRVRSLRALRPYLSSYYWQLFKS